MTGQNFSQELNRKVLIITMSISVVFVVLRSIARWFKTKRLPFAPEDVAMYVALAAFIIQCALYLAAMPTLYATFELQAGLRAPWPTMQSDLKAMLKEFLTVLIFFWLTLWAVKASLLLMFKRLTVGLPVYERIWWGVMVFVILTFIGAVISDFTSCHSMHAWFNAGECTLPRDSRAKAISLWFALAVDLLTDLMIMAIPIRLLWNLQISRQEKLALGVVFAVGVITMIVAIVRTVSLDSTTGGNGGQVSTQWLIFWGAIEGMVAIIVGCLPAFAIFLRGHVQASHGGKYRFGPYSAQSPGQSLKDSRQKSKIRTESMQLDDLPVDSSMDLSSKKNLVHEPKDGIRVSHRWTQKWHSSSEEDINREQGPAFGYVHHV